MDIIRAVVILAVVEVGVVVMVAKVVGARAEDPVAVAAEEVDMVKGSIKVTTKVWVNVY